ncbi:4'-phosphopantetheinyl transferase [Streptomyces sp. NPDC051366]|uniref:4'-phosphopantetheinyl transferase n=1 Tax=Streptomyces sp. NPDC051366 TaxID=3365652 RepID=UPI0037BB0660
MIEELLPAAVSVCESFEDTAAPVLFPEEERLVTDAIPCRRLEFGTVRMCARTALARIGVPSAPLLRGPGGAPTWPSGVVGSMTHCAGYRAAAVAHGRYVRTIGLDAEPNKPLPDGVLELVTIPSERAWLPSATARRPDVAWDRLVFSAKESVYKAWFPVTGHPLEFEDAEVRVNIDAGTFTAKLLIPAPTIGESRLRKFEGRWLARDGLLATATAVLGSAEPRSGHLAGRGHSVLHRQGWGRRAHA